MGRLLCDLQSWGIDLILFFLIMSPWAWANSAAMSFCSSVLFVEIAFAVTGWADALDCSCFVSSWVSYLFHDKLFAIATFAFCCVGSLGCFADIFPLGFAQCDFHSGFAVSLFMKLFQCSDGSNIVASWVFLSKH